MTVNQHLLSLLMSDTASTNPISDEADPRKREQALCDLAIKRIHTYAKDLKLYSRKTPVRMEVNSIYLGDRRFLMVSLSEDIHKVAHSLMQYKPNPFYRVVLMILFISMAVRKRGYRSAMEIKKLFREKMSFPFRRPRQTGQIRPTPSISSPVSQRVSADTRLAKKFQGFHGYQPGYFRVFRVVMLAALIVTVSLLCGFLSYSYTTMTTVGGNILNAFEIIYLNWGILYLNGLRLEPICPNTNCTTAAKGVQSTIQSWASSRMKKIWSTPDAFTVKDPLDASSNLTVSGNPQNVSFYSMWQLSMSQIYWKNSTFDKTAVISDTMETIYNNFQPRMFSSSFQDQMAVLVSNSMIVVWLVAAIASGLFIWALTIFQYNKNFINFLCGMVQFFDFESFSSNHFSSFLQAVSLAPRKGLDDLPNPTQQQGYVVNKKMVPAGYFRSSHVLRTMILMTLLYGSAVGVYILTIKWISAVTIRPYVLRFTIQKTIFTLAAQANQMLNPATNITITPLQFGQNLTYFLHLMREPSGFGLIDQQSFINLANNKICSNSSMTKYLECSTAFGGIINTDLDSVFNFMDNFVSSRGTPPYQNPQKEASFITMLLWVAIYMRAISLYVQSEAALLMVPLWPLTTSVITGMVVSFVGMGVAVLWAVFAPTSSEFKAVIRILNLVNQQRAFSNSKVRALIDDIG